MAAPPEDDQTHWITRLYDLYAPPLFRYAVMVLADAAAAEDVVHDVFAGLLKKPRVMDDERKYLWTAVRNECFSRLRARQRQPAVMGNGAALLEAIRIDDDPRRRLALEAALRVLSAEQREVVHLKAFEGRTFEEIAALLDEPLGTVATRYRAAVAVMQKVLETRHD